MDYKNADLKKKKTCLIYDNNKKNVTVVSTGQQPASGSAAGRPSWNSWPCWPIHVWRRAACCGGLKGGSESTGGRDKWTMATWQTEQHNAEVGG